MPSQSYATFKCNLVQVDRLIKTYDNELSGKPGKHALDHLTRAGLIFLCSSFEVYVESVIRECGDIVVSFINLPGELPVETKKKISESVKLEKHDLSPILYYENWKKYYNDMIYNETSKLNTPKINNIKSLFFDYFGISKSEIDENNFPFSGVDDIVSVRGSVAHNLYCSEYLTRAKFIEYYDTIKASTKELDKILYMKLPEIIHRMPWHKSKDYKL